jgi:hypothetical protein
MVDKIINYESQPLENSWYNTLVAIGSDPFPDLTNKYLEGEIVCDKISSIMTDFETIKLYGSNRYIDPDYTPLTDNIIREIKNGCGHLLFGVGHGSPFYWNTLWPYDFNSTIKDGGINVYDFPSLSNGEKLPLVVAMGCHNAQFNVTFLSTLLNKPYSGTYGIPIAECWSWSFTRKIGGGAIATLGNTGLGYGAGGEVGDRDGDGIDEPDIVEGYGGYLIRLFYETIEGGEYTLGDLWGESIRKYNDVYPGMAFQWDAKIIEEWTLIGDPSLEVGGRNK